MTGVYKQHEVELFKIRYLFVQFASEFGPRVDALQTMFRKCLSNTSVFDTALYLTARSRHLMCTVRSFTFSVVIVRCVKLYWAVHGDREMFAVFSVGTLLWTRNHLLVSQFSSLESMETLVQIQPLKLLLASTRKIWNNRHCYWDHKDSIASVLISACTVYFEKRMF